MKDKLITAIPMYQNDELVGIIQTSGSGSFKVYKVEPMSYDELADYIIK